MINSYTKMVMMMMMILLLLVVTFLGREQNPSGKRFFFRGTFRKLRWTRWLSIWHVRDLVEGGGQYEMGPRPIVINGDITNPYRWPKINGFPSDYYFHLYKWSYGTPL